MVITRRLGSLLIILLHLFSTFHTLGLLFFFFLAFWVGINSNVNNWFSFRSLTKKFSMHSWYQIKANAVRALGNLSRFVPLTSNSSAYYRPNKCTGHLMHSSVQSFQISDDPRNNPNSNKKLLEESHWLEKMVQTFLSCVSTGNVKVYHLLIWVNFFKLRLEL